MIGLDAWFASGQRIPLTQGVRIFSRVAGTGSWVTFLHGFPTCSWDWAAVADSLGSDHQMLLSDLLGYGDSDKPAGHAYSLVEQADLIEALWRHHGITETALVAHDIGGSVAQELLGRQLDTHLTKVVFLNAALYQGLSRPRPIQRLLSNPAVGPVLSRFVTERLFTRNLAATFSATHPLSNDVAHQYWLTLRRRSTSPHIHRLLSYIPERARHHVRWESALEHARVPLSFVWGMDDPVSGAPVLGHIRGRLRLRSAQVVTLEGVGHFPQLEVPELVASALRGAL